MMRPSSLERLIALFARFPGVGARQAARFAYFLVDENKEQRAEVSAAIDALDGIRRCDICFRMIAENDPCPICRDVRRDESTIIVLEKDANLEAFEYSGTYDGQYCVLGGTLSEFDEADSVYRERVKKLYSRIKNSPRVREVILAMNATSEGSFTARFIEKVLEPFQRERAIKITHLGRGISAGAEIEYLNRDTLKDALENRR